MRQSNTGEKNITYDVVRDRFRVEMRVGKISRTARCKTLSSAIDIRNTWLDEREKHQSSLQSNQMHDKAVFSIEHREIEVNFS